MKINFNSFSEGKSETIEFDSSFPSELFSPSHIIGVKACHSKAVITKLDEYLNVDLKVKYTAIVPCAYTLEEIEYTHTENEKFIFAYENDEENGIDPVGRDGYIDLDECVLDLIVATVPFNLHKKGATLPKGGDGYSVLTEDELNEERSKSSPFDALDELDLK
ncbi:MAG: YceD family protein [Coprobacillus sp.]|nr:YceD family protein [Coprobacillus sp.]